MPEKQSKASKKNNKPSSLPVNRPLAVNRQARFNYEISETIEAGLALTGTEIKSIRQGNVDIRDAVRDAKERVEAFMVEGGHPVPSVVASTGTFAYNGRPITTRVHPMRLGVPPASVWKNLRQKHSLFCRSRPENYQAEVNQRILFGQVCSTLDHLLIDLL